MIDEWAGTPWASTEVEARAIDSFVDYPDLTTQLLRVQGIIPRPWRPASVSEALGVPAIFGAVTLISKTVGSLTMRALRNEVELPPDDRPRVIIRPDPFRIPSEFYTQTAYNMATRGEAWWWIAKRDGDGNALSVLNIPPAELTVVENQRDLLRPIIQWRGVPMRNEDLRQIVYHRDSPLGLRGIGPLQVCQAAMSIAVESQEFAANFYADGGQTGLVIHSADELADDPNDPDGVTEAERFADAWSSKGNNRPRVVDPRVSEIQQLDFNPQGAQMLDARQHEVGEWARAFSMPATLLDYAVSGSSLTYQNLESQYDDFLRRCLRPNYLRPIEETMSDLLPRSTVARFDTDALTLADIKTRFDVYNIGIPLGVMSLEEARAKEGLAPGDTDNAPVPFSVPQAIPAELPIQQPRAAELITDWRCSCGKKLAEAAGPGSRVKCRCGKVNMVPMVETRTTEDPMERFAAMIALSDERQQSRMEMLLSRQESAKQEVNIAEGAMQVHISAPPPQVHIAPPTPTEVNVTLPETQVHVDAPVVNVAAAELPAPIVNVTTPETPAPIVNVTTAEIPAPVVNVAPADMSGVEETLKELGTQLKLDRSPKKRRVERDPNGLIVGLSEWEEAS